MWSFGRRRDPERPRFPLPCHRGRHPRRRYTINLPDTVGYATSDETHLSTIPGARTNADRAIFSAHCHDVRPRRREHRARSRAAPASAECTISGSERRRNASLEELVMAFRVSTTVCRDTGSKRTGPYERANCSPSSRADRSRPARQSSAAMRIRGRYPSGRCAQDPRMRTEAADVGPADRDSSPAHWPHAVAEPVRASVRSRLRISSRCTPSSRLPSIALSATANSGASSSTATRRPAPAASRRAADAGYGRRV